ATHVARLRAHREFARRAVSLVSHPRGAPIGGCAMGFLLHHHPGHRARQLRWVVPLGAFLLVAVLATLAIQYRVSNQEVGTELFRAHKTISHTGELLQRGLVIGSAVLVLLVLGVTLWAFRV